MREKREREGEREKRENREREVGGREERERTKIRHSYEIRLVVLDFPLSAKHFFSFVYKYNYLKKYSKYKVCRKKKKYPRANL